MKTKNHPRFILLVLTSLFLALPIQSCIDEEELPVTEEELPATVEFEMVLRHVSEGGAIDIILTLAPAPANDGSVTLIVGGNCQYLNDFTSTPAAVSGTISLSLIKGQQTASFSLQSIDNSTLDGDRHITLTLDELLPEFKPGKNASMTIQIDDDEGPSIANFENFAGTVNELEQDGIEIPVILSPSAKGSGTVSITINPGNAKYEDDFITVPAPDVLGGNMITLPVTPNDTRVSFTVLPVHNHKVTQHLQPGFSISAVDGVVQKGNSLNYSLTIINSDVESLVNFATPAGSVNEENSGGIEIEIPFSAQAPGEGEITVSFISTGIQHTTHFTIDKPVLGNNTFVLPVANQQENARFKVFPLNNIHCADGSVTFTISFANGSVKKGTDLSYKLTFIDDEVASFISFSPAFAQLNESDAAGVLVTLNFSSPSLLNAPLYINSHCTFYPFEPEPRFYTNPETTCDWYGDSYVELPVSQGATSVQFTVYPVNNSNKDGNYVWQFNSLWSANACLRQAPATSLILTIIDND